MKTIYVIDDEIMITELLNSVLSRNYKVVTFNDPSIALNVFAKDIYIPDCIISDVTMPKINGFELVLEVRMRRIDLPVILMTGKSFPLTYFPTVVSINKPFSLIHLKKTIHDIIYPGIYFNEKL